MLQCWRTRSIPVSSPCDWPCSAAAAVNCTSVSQPRSDGLDMRLRLEPVQKWPESDSRTDSGSDTAYACGRGRGSVVRICGGPSVFKVHEANASGRQSADVFPRYRHAGGHWQLEGCGKAKSVTAMEYYCWRLMQRDGRAWTLYCAVTGCSSSTLSTPGKNGTATAKLFVV